MKNSQKVWSDYSYGDLGMIEKVARKLCEDAGYDPDKKVFNVFAAGIPNRMWAYFADRASRALQFEHDRRIACSMLER